MLVKGDGHCMNYYDKHIGDWLKDTICLDAMQEGIYSRLIDQYYQLEMPLPSDIKEVYKLARVSKKKEKDAVDYILKKYFEKKDEGFVQKRAQEVIEKFWEKDADSDAKKENDRDRQQRARERRKTLFTELRNHGIVADWNTTTGELQRLLSRVTDRDSNAPVTPSVTGDNTAIHQPIPNTQYPVLKPITSLDTSSSVGTDDPPEIERPKNDRNIEIAVLLRAGGIKPMTAIHPLACEWATNPKITDELLKGAIDMAKQYKPNESISPNYLKPIIEQLLTAPAEPKAQGPKQDDWFRSNAGIDRKGRELGMYARGTESYNDFKDRIFAKLRDGGKAA